MSTQPLLAFVIPNEGARLSALRATLRKQLEACGIDERALYAVDLTLEELGGNLLRYGYEPGARGELQVEVLVSPTMLLVTLVDDGRPFDPTAHSEPITVGSIDEAPLGGRGISLVRRFTRSMRYHREPGRNRIEVEIPCVTVPHRTGREGMSDNRIPH